MARRRKIDSEDVGERITTSLRLPVELLERIDKAWKGSDKYTGRTHFIEKACEHYLNCEPCPKCMHLNHKRALVCSFCGAKLGLFSKNIEYIESHLPFVHEVIDMISHDIESYDNLVEKIYWLIEKLPPTTKSDVEGAVSYISRQNNRVLGARHFMMVRELYSTYDKLPLPNPAHPINEKYTLDYVAHMSDFNSKYRKKATDNISNQMMDNNLFVVCYCRSCEIILENPDNYTLKDVRNAYNMLDKMTSHLISLKNSVGAALDVLVGFEKMITILIQNQNT